MERQRSTVPNCSCPGVRGNSFTFEDLQVALPPTSYIPQSYPSQFSALTFGPIAVHCPSTRAPSQSRSAGRAVSAPVSPRSMVVPKVVLIGVAGPTCSGQSASVLAFPCPKTRSLGLTSLTRTHSGKTTLSKHLRNIMPGCVILHQDDFAPPSEVRLHVSRLGLARPR